VRGSFGVRDRIALRKARLRVTYAPRPALVAGMLSPPERSRSAALKSSFGRLP